MDFLRDHVDIEEDYAWSHVIVYPLEKPLIGYLYDANQALCLSSEYEIIDNLLLDNNKLLRVAYEPPEKPKDEWVIRFKLYGNADKLTIVRDEKGVVQILKENGEPINGRFKETLSMSNQDLPNKCPLVSYLSPISVEQFSSRLNEGEAQLKMRNRNGF